MLKLSATQLHVRVSMDSKDRHQGSLQCIKVPVFPCPFVRFNRQEIVVLSRRFSPTSSSFIFILVGMTYTKKELGLCETRFMGDLELC